jgi:acyl transferase domain-containing protein
MGRKLYEQQPTFRASLERCADLLQPFLPRPLQEVLFTESGGLLNETAYTQPALFALEYALAELWQSWGVVPDAVLGHSVGEYVAACLAGVFSLEEGLELIAERARLMQALPPDGTMAAVFAPEERVAPLLAGHEADVSLAALNGPSNTVISGRREAIEAMLRACQAEGLKAKALAVSHAFHSPLLEPMLAEFEVRAARVDAQVPQLPLVANLTGRVFGPNEKPTAEYWRRHARQPVRFADGMATLVGLGCEVFLEVGPHPTLLALGQTCLPPGGHAWLPSLRQGQDDWRVLLEAVANLYVRGREIDWRGLDRDYPCRPVALPTYPFERQRHWLGVPAAPDHRPPPAPRAAPGHPLIGKRVR